MDTTGPISRRSMLIGTSTVAILAMLGGHTRAQEYKEAVAFLTSALPSIFSPQARFRADDGFVKDFLTEEEGARTGFFERIADEDPANLLPDLDPAASQIGVTSPQDVALVKVAPDEVEQIKVMRENPPVEGEGLIEVVLQIVVDTMDWRFLLDALKQLLRSDGYLAEKLDGCAEALRIRDMDGALGNLIDIASHVVTVDTLTRLAGFVDGDAAALRRRVLKTLGLRLIPFVGWAFTGGCLAVCVYSYRERLVAALR